MSTISEKILAAKAGLKELSPGEIVEAEVDYVMVNDVTAMPAFPVFDELGLPPLKEKGVFIPDHYVPNKDVPSAEQAKAMREFVAKHKLPHYFEVGKGGVCHQVMIERGFVAPGRLIVGADSHTCSYGALGAFATGIGSTEAACAMVSGKLWFKVPESQKFTVEGELGEHVMGKDIILHVIGDVGVDGSLYKTMEWYGSAIESLPLADRISISNMAIEAGGKAGIIPADKKVDEYLKGRVRGKYKAVYSDEGAVYSEEFTYDASEIPCTVSEPFLPENAKAAADVNVEIDQAYIGSCTNGRIEDFRVAAGILKGRNVKGGVRLLIVPASHEIMDQMIEEGLYDVFRKAGAYISGPTCGACLGGYMGVLANEEVCVSTTNRNFIGRMGHKGSKVYLANPAVVAASAITGKITDPNNLK
ncbi:MAG: homoaconitate hydratase family protein [Candidatus Altiarchaeales archaeon]|nr:homoaconitate hydratase family protein [Candidatus Altiarchaeales archaeon]MBD3415856.1 homoaconitate hydratase family protein [Candidatus Altiarchaeales archaeon]